MEVNLVLRCRLRRYDNQRLTFLKWFARHYLFVITVLGSCGLGEFTEHNISNIFIEHQGTWLCSSSVVETLVFTIADTESCQKTVSSKRLPFPLSMNIAITAIFDSKSNLPFMH